jgi:hypothetical protein
MTTKANPASPAIPKIPNLTISLRFGFFGIIEGKSPGNT